ncbi:MAG: ribokinase [Verrucomicrobia bacterium]|nr:ribokinase [Verrucomicrobiota bacterium]
MKPSIVVVGSFNQDLTWSCAEFPSPGETIVGRFQTGPGGKGSNQAVAAARAGGATAFVGAVGDDGFGREAEAFLRAEGIDLHLARKKLPTGNAAILVNRRGENQIVIALGANAALAPRDVPADLVRGARVVVCQHETSLTLNAHVFRTARRAGVTTVLNPAPMRADFDPRILDYTDVLIPNETEFVTLVNRRGFTEKSLRALSPHDLHRLCRAFELPTVIVTLGARGCFVSQHRGHLFIPAHRGIKVVDTTGAGDAFVGGFAAGLARYDGNIATAARYGNATAALSVTKFGTAPSMPAQRAIEKLLKQK